MPETCCPHGYVPAGATSPTYICRGCGSLVADPQHPQNAVTGNASAHQLVGRPEIVTQPRKAERRA